MPRTLALPIVLALLAGCEEGSYFNPNTRQIKADQVARVTSMDEDFRLYEFTPQTDPAMQCVFVAATQKGGVFCWEKRQPTTTGVPR